MKILCFTHALFLEIANAEVALDAIALLYHLLFLRNNFHKAEPTM